MLDLIAADDLARRMGYARASSAFRDWCAKIGITPVPGRRGVYDPELVRKRLDQAQGLRSGEGAPEASLVAQRRARRAKA